MKVVFMSDRIQELLDGIREKALKWHQQYTAERAANQELQGEISALKTSLAASQQEVADLKQLNSELETKLESTQNMGVSASEGTAVPDEQIDELVKEIEYCIAQLKK